MLLKKVRRGSIRKRPFLVEEMTFLKSCAQQDLNLYLKKLDYLLNLLDVVLVHEVGQAIREHA